MSDTVVGVVVSVTEGEEGHRYWVATLETEMRNPSLVVLSAEQLTEGVIPVNEATVVTAYTHENRVVAWDDVPGVRVVLRTF